MDKVLKYIKIVPLAAESLGVRSMCTYIETRDVRILLDAGVSVCPNRFGLPPHPLEFRAIAECRRKIADAAQRAEIVTVSHYHYDHHTPSYEDWLCNWTAETETAMQIYSGKVVLMKNPREHVNYSQRRRGWMFQRNCGEYAKTLDNADGKAFVYDDTCVRFSEPVFHGPEGSFLGWVLTTAIECQGEKFIFAPDVQGPMSSTTLDMLIKERPLAIMIGGPPLYLAGFKVDESQIKAGLKNLENIVMQIPITILDHHILRDEEWSMKSTSLLHQAYESGHTVLTSAGMLGLKENLLEAHRKKLFVDEPPSKEFEKWMKASEEAKRKLKPPL